MSKALIESTATAVQPTQLPSVSGNGAQSAKAPNGAASIAARVMRRMVPRSQLGGNFEEAPPASTLLCHLCLLNSVMERAGNRAAEQHGLTLTQWLALGCIGNCGEEGIRHTELGHRLMLSKAPITGVVDRLERSGYVQRLADATDRRVMRIVITPAGEATWSEARLSMRQCATNLWEPLTLSEQEQVISLLGRVLESAAGADPILRQLD